MTYTMTWQVYAANENDVTALSEAAVGGAVLVCLNPKP